MCCFALIFSDFNIKTDSAWGLMLLLSFILMVFYEIYWIRYFRSEKKMSDFYCSLLCFPVAGATLPIGAFILLAVYGCNIFLLLSAVILGIGHIGIHLGHLEKIHKDEKKKNMLLNLKVEII